MVHSVKAGRVLIFVGLVRETFLIKDPKVSFLALLTNLIYQPLVYNLINNCAVVLIVFTLQVESV